VTIFRSALRAADTLALASGYLRVPLSADRLIEIARRRSRLDDFGETEITEPLRRLLASTHAEASLSLVGRLALRWDVLRFLTNLLDLAAAERRSPDIVREPIERPLFIAGLPRSGTTFLHQLMMCDPANRAPLVWETIYPYPGPDDARAQDRRAERVARQLRTFERLAPDFRGLHQISAVSPQECTEILAHSFRSLRFDTTYRIPAYRTWLETDADNHLPAYRLHKRFLQHLQHQAGPSGRDQRWVLKCPDHLFALDALAATYPDARLVFVHRDPVRVLLSVARLTEVLRRPFTRRIDRLEIGRQESARWLEGAERMIEAAGPICHVHYLDLIADPTRTVGAVYDHFGLPFTPATAAAITQFAAERPNGGYAPHHYRFADHGLDAEAEREKFRPYLSHFNVTPEPSHHPSEARPRGSAPWNPAKG
jgi:hypothetical protein